MHAYNMTVFPCFLRDDQILYGNSEADQTKTVVMKGVDGIFTDFVSSTLRAVTLIGTQSTLALQSNVTILTFNEAIISLLSIYGLLSSLGLLM